MNRTKKVYQTDLNGVYIGDTVANISPLDIKEVWLIPAGAVEKEPPTFDDKTQFIQWVNNEWIVKDIPVIEKVIAPIIEEKIKEEKVFTQPTEEEIQTEIRKMAIERLQNKK